MTREEAITILGDYEYILFEDEDTYNREAFRMAIKALEQEPTKEEQALLQKWRDNRGISIEEFEDAMNALQEPTDENLHREREQAYMQGYEEASKRFRQEPCDDAISRDFEIGDEVRIIGSNPIYDDGDVGWVIRNASEKVKTMYVMRNDGSAGEEAKAEWYKTGRHNAMLAEVIKALPSVTQKSGWISVSERLPEESGNYLITYCLQGEIETQEAVYVKDEEDKWFDITNIEITLAVVAWMPLPKPYEPQESEDKE